MKNYYQEIKLNPTMKIDQIKESLNEFETYWKQRLSSPDLAIKQAAEDNLKLLEEAKVVLLDENKKAEYDNKLKESYLNNKYQGIKPKEEPTKAKEPITEEQKEKIKEATIKSIEKVSGITKKFTGRSIDFIKANSEKAIIGILAIGCVISTGFVIKNTSVDKESINSLKEENKMLTENINQIEDENKSLDKELSVLVSDNEEITTQVENITDTKFTAVAGTKWIGTRNYYGSDNVSRPINLDIANDEIIMSMQESTWNRYENGEGVFTGNISLATGNVDKETGYMKLNRIDFINPPEGTEDYKDEYCDYSYECIVNGNKITGLLINNENKIIGNIILDKVD